MEKREISIAPETILLSVAALFLAFLLFQFLSTVRIVIIIVLLAIVIGEAIEPLVGIIQSRGVGRAFATVLSYLLVVEFFLFLGVLIVPSLVVQLQNLALNLPQAYQQFMAYVGPYLNLDQAAIPQQYQQAVSDLTSKAAQLLPSLLLFPLQVGALFFAATAILVISFYWLLAAPSLRDGVLALVPEKWRQESGAIMSEMAERVGGWVRGQIVLSTSIAIMTFLGLFLLNIPFPVVLAVWAGFTEVIPMVGPILGGIPAVIIAFFISPLHALIVLVLYFVIQQIEAQLLVPNVMSRSVGLHPLLVIVALLIGAEIQGIIGALLAVPLAAALQVLVVHIARMIWRREEGEPAESGDKPPPPLE